FSHCYLKRFMAFSNDSPSLTRTPGILRITTFRPAKGPPAEIPSRENAAVKAQPRGCQTYMHRHRCTFTATRTPLTLALRMTDARLSVTLPEYETELAATQRTAMRNAALLAAPLLVAFTFLDRAATPPFWLPLLGLRLAAASVLGLVARLTERLSSAFPLTLISVAVICTTIEAA